MILFVLILAEGFENHLLLSRTCTARCPDRELHPRKETFENISGRLGATESVCYSQNRVGTNSMINANNEFTFLAA